MKFGSRVILSCESDVSGLEKRDVCAISIMWHAPHGGLNRGGPRYGSMIISLALSNRYGSNDNGLYMSSYSNETLDIASQLVTVTVHVIIMIVISLATVAKGSLL